MMFAYYGENQDDKVKEVNRQWAIVNSPFAIHHSLFTTHHSQPLTIHALTWQYLFSKIAAKQNG
jgi:hypothetical protein